MISGAATRIRKAFFSALSPPVRLRLSEWANKFAVLSAESSAEPGRWQCIPYQVGIMDACTDPALEQIWVMKSARVGWTKIINHLVGYHIHYDPCPISVVQPSDPDAEGYSKEELGPMLRDTPVLAAIMPEGKSRDSGSTILQKLFPGGVISIIGATSPRGFRRISRRVMCFDEVDGYPVGGAGDEGDQIRLGIKRTEYFWNRKILGGSTPTLKETSRIERQFELGDQRRFFMPCPVCDAPQYLKFQNMKWPEGEPEKAYFQCEANECEIPHSKKKWMLDQAQARHEADPSGPYGWKATAVSSNPRIASFHIWAAYSTSPNAAWGQLAREFVEAKEGGPELLKTYVNLVLGETWEDAHAAKLGAGDLQARAENYEPSVVPENALALVAGVDVQDNRIAISLWGYGRGEESWVVSHQEIYGDPAEGAIWKQLDQVILRKYRHARGGTVPVLATCIDTGGHFTHEAYQWARERRNNFVLAIKGSSIRGREALGKPSKKDVNFAGRVLKNAVSLYLVGTDTIKSALYRRLKLKEPGAGYVHFHAQLGDEYFQQLTAEHQAITYKDGRQIRKWVKKSNGTRNEALDTAVYAYAAMQSLYTRFARVTIWDQLEKKIRTAADTEAVVAAAEAAKKLPVAAESEPDTVLDVTGLEEISEPELKIARRKAILRRTSRGKGFVNSY